MSELLGIIVLSMPILAVLCIGGLAGFAGWAAGRRVRKAKQRWITSVSAVLVVILLFMWDEVVGRLYFHYLCTTEGGSKVYKQVRLSSEYWRPDGTPIFLDENGSKIPSALDDTYTFERTGEQQASTFLRIKRYVEFVFDRNTRELLGASTAFHYFGGWFVNQFGMDVKGIHCPIRNDEYSHFLLALFVSGQQNN